jgi:hypothetical protein
LGGLRWIAVLGLLGAGIVGWLSLTGDRPPAATAPSVTGPPAATAPSVTGPPSTGLGETPTTTRLDPESLERYEELIRRELRRGHVVYNPPERMRLGQTRELEVRVSRRLTPEVTATLSGGGDPVTEPLPIATRMRAELTGAGFEIESRGSPAVQLIRKEGYRSWVWSVTPTKAGRHDLNLTIYALAPEAGNEDALDYRVFYRSIEVDVSAVQTATGWLSRNLATIGTISALLGVTAAGAVGAAARRFRRRTGPDTRRGQPASDLAKANGRRRRRRRQPRETGQPTARDGGR